MPALVAGIYVFLDAMQVVDARHKAGHDDGACMGYAGSGLPAVSGRNGVTMKPSA